MPHIDLGTLLIFILYNIIVAGITAYYANLRGKNPLLWFVIGMVTGVFALLILLLFQPVKKESEKDELPTMTVLEPDPALKEASSHEPDELKLQEGEDKLWYYLDQNHQQVGPVSVIALRELWNRGQLELNHYVWTAGMQQWEKVNQLPELKLLLNKTI